MWAYKATSFIRFGAQIILFSWKHWYAMPGIQVAISEPCRRKQGGYHVYMSYRSHCYESRCVESPVCSGDPGPASIRNCSNGHWAGVCRGGGVPHGEGLSGRRHLKMVDKSYIVTTPTGQQIELKLTRETKVPARANPGDRIEAKITEKGQTLSVKLIGDSGETR